MILGDEKLELKIKEIPYKNFTPFILPQTDSVGMGYWLSVSFDNVSEETIHLKTTINYHDSVVVYRKNTLLDSTPTLLSSNNGFLLNISERHVKSYQNSFIELPVPPGKWTFYLNVINGSKLGSTLALISHNIGMAAYSESYFKNWFKFSELFNLFQIGFITSIILFNIALLIVSKLRLYFFLILYNLCFIYWLLIDGQIIVLMNPDVDMELMRILSFFPTILLASSYALFNNYAFDLKKHLPFVHWLLITIICVHMTAILFYSLEITVPAQKIEEIGSTLEYLLVLLGSIYLAYKRIEYSKPFLVAAIFWTGAVGYFFYVFTDPELNYIYANIAIQSCFLVDVIIYTTITTLRFMNFRKQAITMELESITLKDELSQKSRQLTTYLMEQASRTNALASIKENIKSSSAQDSDKRTITKEINQLLSSEQNWEDFKVHFEGVHPDFFKRLESNFPILSNNDLRLAAYVRIGLKNKEISNILRITEKGVEKAKTRLKKKMEVNNLAKAVKTF